MLKAAAFDFDGLLVDGLNECVLISWNGFHKKSLDAFGPAGLEAVPEQFIETFTNHRNFARHLGHFVAPFYLTRHFSSQAQFDAAFACIDGDAVEEFVARAAAYRNLARSARHQRWLQYHAFYPGVEQLLKNASCPIYIVTGKDAASVDKLLRGAGIVVPAARIFGDCRDKVPVLKRIAATESAEPAQLGFFDDNVTNACNAHANGFSSYWATWGYHAPDHAALARAAGVPALALDAFTAMKFETGIRH
jgi:phosphoglycolate phosphatase-like HAD superfamily hydrolase